MTIDGCRHDFPGLASEVLPAHMKELKAAMTRPLSMADFSKRGEGVRSLLAKHGLEEDFSGCYVLVDPQPIYVGISRGVFARLRQHVTGRTHFDASLAYRMAKEDAPHKHTRDAAMGDVTFKKLFESKRDFLRKLKVATVTIDCPVELHLFEVYAALALKTSKWNTFRTH
jgi:hypothetical protein